MGFWDFIAPDLASFREVMRPTLNPSVQVGDRLVPADQFIDAAYLSPGGAFGMAARIYYELHRTTGQPPSVGDVVNNALQQQGAAVTNRGIWATVEGEMTLVIPNTYRVAIRMIAGGKTITNVVGVTGSASGQQAAAAAAVLAAWKGPSGPLAQMSSLITMQDVEAVDLSSTTGGISLVADATAGGVSTTNSLSTRASAALITWNSGTRSRSARGRMYLGPLRETQIDTDGATLLSPTRASIDSAIGAFRSSLASAGFPLVVISTKLASTTQVTSHAVQSTIATQRRRLRS